jgi:ADP-heptose:LPS heptosyltransferase
LLLFFRKEVLASLTRILIIRLGALGDFVLSFGPFAAIRAHHPDAEITLLTTAPYAALAQGCPWFDRVVIDPRPRWWQLGRLLHLTHALHGFDFVYDLQTSGRSSRYFLLAGRPPWSGIAPGCSHPQTGPARARMHTIERQRDQLRLAGIHDFPRPDLGWLMRGALPDLPERFAMLVPGAAPTRPAKRWPVAHFAQLAAILARRGLPPVIVGSSAEAELAGLIVAACPTAMDLTGATSLPDLFTLAARASLAVGNDTGPMHIAAAVGCPSVVLFSADSDPDMTAPRSLDGGWPVILRETDLADLSVERVAAALP